MWDSGEQYHMNLFEKEGKKDKTRDKNEERTKEARKHKN